MPEFLGKLVIPRLASAPSPPTQGQMYYNTSDSRLYVYTGSAWEGSAVAFRTGHTFAVFGDLTTVTTLPSFFVPKTALQTVSLVGIRADIVSGTSVGVQVKRNGSNVGSVITVTTTTATTALGPTALSDGDEITIALSAHTGVPTSLGATVILETNI